MAVFLNMAERRPQLLVDHLPAIKKAVERHPSTLSLAAQVISFVGKLNKVSQHPNTKKIELPNTFQMGQSGQ